MYAFMRYFAKCTYLRFDANSTLLIPITDIIYKNGFCILREKKYCCWFENAHMIHNPKKLTRTELAQGAMEQRIMNYHLKLWLNNYFTEERDSAFYVSKNNRHFRKKKTNKQMTYLEVIPTSESTSYTWI